MNTSVTTKTVLIAGLPRSGTTWVGRVFGRTAGTRYVHEPDNHLLTRGAWEAKRGLGPHPFLAPGDEAPAYEALFAAAFAGGTRPWRRAVPARTWSLPAHPARSGPVVVKSVFSSGSLNWLAARFDPAVVVVERHPWAVVGSWAALGWTSFSDGDPAAVRHALEQLGVAPPRPGAAWIDRAAWHYGLLASALERAVAGHPGWRRVRHERLCADPVGGFRSLCAELGLTWTAGTARFLAATNRPGRGYQTRRVWAEEAVVGRTRLSPGERDRLDEILAAFPQEVIVAGSVGGVAPVGDPRRLAFPAHQPALRRLLPARGRR